MDGYQTMRRCFDTLCGHPRRIVLALIALCLAVYLPGVIRLPAVDRTEIIYAETTRDMLARGAYADPRYGDTVHQFRPIGTYWAQGASAALAGPDNARSITVYRLPGMIAVMLSVLALFTLSRPLIGNRAAAIAASLFAVTPLTVLLAQLSITEGLTLLPATVAMLALLRLYTAGEDEEIRTVSLLLWTAVGLGMLLNALQTPILIAATTIALFVMDRDVTWLRRTRPMSGVPLALIIASPWILVRAHQDGVPFSGLSWRDFIEALGGSQDMKLKAWPGTFVAAAALGFLPGTVLLVPAISTLWSRRSERLPRFLTAWIIGYLVYLEAISSKPGTYSVQVLFPAFAIAVAMLVVVEDGKLPLPRWHAVPWPPAAALFALVLFAVIYGVTGSLPGILALALIAAVAALFYTSAAAARAGRLHDWALNGAAALALFAVTLLAAVLPSIGKLWTAQSITAAVTDSCGPGTAANVLGFREPSSIFLLGGTHTPQSPDSLAGDASRVAIVESRWLERYFVAYAVRHPGKLPGPAIGCVTAFNVMRGCPLSFTMFVPEGSNTCKAAPNFRCDTDEKVSPRPPSQGCD